MHLFTDSKKLKVVCETEKIVQGVVNMAFLSHIKIEETKKEKCYRSNTKTITAVYRSFQKLKNNYLFTFKTSASRVAQLKAVKIKDLQIQNDFKAS